MKVPFYKEIIAPVEIFQVTHKIIQALDTPKQRRQTIQLYQAAYTYRLYVSITVDYQLMARTMTESNWPNGSYYIQPIFILTSDTALRAANKGAAFNANMKQYRYAPRVVSLTLVDLYRLHFCASQFGVANGCFKHNKPLNGTDGGLVPRNICRALIIHLIVHCNCNASSWENPLGNYRKKTIGGRLSK